MCCSFLAFTFFRASFLPFLAPFWVTFVCFVNTHPPPPHLLVRQDIAKWLLERLGLADLVTAAKGPKGNVTVAVENAVEGRPPCAAQLIRDAANALASEQLPEEPAPKAPTAVANFLGRVAAAVSPLVPKKRASVSASSSVAKKPAGPSFRELLDCALNEIWRTPESLEELAQAGCPWLRLPDTGALCLATCWAALQDAQCRDALLPPEHPLRSKLDVPLSVYIFVSAADDSKGFEDAVAQDVHELTEFIIRNTDIFHAPLKYVLPLSNCRTTTELMDELARLVALQQQVCCQPGTLRTALTHIICRFFGVASSKFSSTTLDTVLAPALTSHQHSGSGVRLFP
jgi:hypothetical protein